VNNLAIALSEQKEILFFLLVTNNQMEIEKYFSAVNDPRDQSKISHLLTDIIGLSLIGTIAGCEGYDDIEEFGIARQQWLKKYLQLPYGIPSHDTIERVFESINPLEFNACFMNWVREIFNRCDSEVLLHIDGKSNKRSGDEYKGKKMLHAINVFAGERRLSLAQFKVDEKCNEITVLNPLLKTLDIKGQTVTIDAIACQKDIAQAITDGQGYYVLAVKDNQLTLNEHIQTAFKTTPVASTHTTEEKDHGRIEKRTCSVITDLRFIDESVNWAALYCIICIASTRIIKNQITTETRYYISSQKQNASFFLNAIRSHWGIENSLHWVLDVLFREDYCRKRKDNAAENFNIIRKMALNIIRNKKDGKKSLRRKRLNAAWDVDYLENLLAF
jgi:predicted transposase YbfD/YdcC